MKKDHRSEFSNLSNWKEEAWKKIRAAIVILHFIIVSLHKRLRLITLWIKHASELYQPLHCDETTFTMQTLMFCNILTFFPVPNYIFRKYTVRGYINLRADAPISEGLYFDILIKFYRSIYDIYGWSREDRRSMLDWRTHNDRRGSRSPFGLSPSLASLTKWRSLYQNALALQSSPKHARSGRYFPPELTLCYVHEKWWLLTCNKLSQPTNVNVALWNLERNANNTPGDFTQ